MSATFQGPQIIPGDSQTNYKHFNSSLSSPVGNTTMFGRYCILLEYPSISRVALLRRSGIQYASIDVVVDITLGYANTKP
jgi:hypothetical protein